MAEAFPIGGQIDPKGFPFLLTDLHRHEATGSLKVDGPSYQKALYFRGGRVLFGSSNDPRDQLGSILIESGKITPEQLEDVNSKVGPGNPLAKVLSDTGFVNQRELSEAARAKVERILSDVIAYTSGSFEFEDGVLPKGAVDLRLSTVRLMISAVRRIADRNFVLRHIESLDVVLAPGADLVSVAEEIAPEADGLPEQLDGQRTLKEAVANTPLDEFEAAKIACALLFLGLVDRRGPFVAQRSSEDDLLQGVADSPEPTGFAVADPAFDAASGSEADAPFSFDAEPAIAMGQGDAPSFDSGDSPTIVDGRAPEAPLFAEPPVLPPTPKVSDPVVEAPPETKAARRLPVVPPPPRGGVPAAAPADAAPTSGGLESSSWPDLSGPEPTQTRPSTDDLAALDELLNSRAPAGEGGRNVKGGRTETWAPQFGHKAPTARNRGRSASGPSKAVLVGGAVLLLAIAAAGAAYFVMQRPATIAPPTTVAAAVPPTVAPAVTLSPAFPTGVEASAGPEAPSDTATTIRPTSAPVSAPPLTPPAASGDSRALLRQMNLPAAAQGFAANLRRAGAGTSSIQLLVACSDETVNKAVSQVDSGELFIVPVNWKGRSCYRVCWGVYPDGARAAQAFSTIPAYFREGGASPKVMAASELVP